MVRFAAALLVLCFTQAPRPDSTVYTIAAVVLRQEPNSRAQVVARLAAWTAVRMASCAKGWCEVGVNGLSGYLPRRTLSARGPR
jgi:SH3-like domain-containing protein